MTQTQTIDTASIAAGQQIEQLQARVAELEDHLGVWSRLYAHAAVEIAAIKKSLPAAWAASDHPMFDTFRRVHAASAGVSEDAALDSFKAYFGRQIVRAWRRDNGAGTEWVEKWLVRFFA